MLVTTKTWSTDFSALNMPWWLIHIVPIVAKLTTYAASLGQAVRSWRASDCDSSPLTFTSRISRVMAMANTPSLNASSRAGDTAARRVDRPVCARVWPWRMLARRRRPAVSTDREIA